MVGSQQISEEKEKEERERLREGRESAQSLHGRMCSEDHRSSVDRRAGG